VRFASIVLTGTFAIALAAGCVGPGIQAQVDVVRADIEKARKSGAYRCAPRELALAESNADFTENELWQGNFLRAQDHVDIAVENAKLALANSKDCGPKRVLIKKNLDQDGDGILDRDDACPEKPEDFDEFEDEDGCPDPDNDQDGVLDPLDKCPLEPEDKDLFEDEDGCPDPDNDQDTVLDVNDKCPNTPGPVDNEGCPVDDRDGDGIPDKTDKCPDDPEDIDGDRDEDGCPDVDTDGDGLEDDVDKCPNDPEDKDEWEDEDGCPDPDNDKDGILDTADACPNEPGPLEARGCPDRDKDNIADKDDKCPDEAGRPSPPNPPDRHGCPILDSDGDGIPDHEDKCPNEVGVAQPDNPEKHGCPKQYKLIVIKKDKIEIKQQVQFDTGKATIKPVSARLLAEVGDAIRSSEGALSKVRIEGHTDSVGSDRYNMRLSDARANSVREWLIDKEGVDASILEAKGYGESRPIASNRTKRGRQQNRRVEFNVDR
jgi:outer membrane protein OmpA-like peptidoglycan-associated protein